LGSIVQPVVKALVASVSKRDHIKVVDIALQLLSEELHENFHGARVAEIRLIMRPVRVSEILMHVSQEVGNGVA
jgi:hypothetical protein